MSYDFTLLHRQPGQSWEQVLEANERRVMQEADRPFSPPRVRGRSGSPTVSKPMTPNWSASPARTASNWTGRTTVACRCRCLSMSWALPSPTGTQAKPPGR
jgi:hypothetical protein